MSAEGNPEHVVGFPLVPVGNRPDITDAWALGQRSFHSILPPRQPDLQCDPVLERKAGEVVNDFQVGFVLEGLGLLRVRLQVIDPAEIVEVVEGESLVVSQRGGDRDD